eukprot:COSAG06_NODE_6919_length_2715_cov_875.793888_3_plen_52_part_00
MSEAETMDVLMLVVKKILKEEVRFSKIIAAAKSDNQIIKLPRIGLDRPKNA